MRFLKFDTLITPSFIRLLFYVSVAISIVGALSAFGVISSMPFIPAPGLLGLLVGLAIAVVGILLSRIVAEMILVVFMIRDELAWQRQAQSSTQALAAE